MNDEVLVSTFRTFLQMLGAVLATLGIVQEAQWPLYSGLIMSSGSLLWMLYARWNTRKVDAGSIVIPPPNPSPDPGARVNAHPFSMVAAIGLAVLMLAGCTQADLESAADKARATLQATCAAYPTVDAAFQAARAAFPNKIPAQVTESEASAVAALKTICDNPPANLTQAIASAGAAYAAALRALADARALTVR